jgi:capsular polysaccharide transport system permease protein
LETNDPNEGRAKEPIKFPGSKDDRREERQRRRQERVKAAEAEGRAAALLKIAPDEPAAPIVEPEQAKGRDRKEKPRRRFQMSWTFLSFLLMVACPGALAGMYFMVFASPQYRVETQFSVRGASQSSMASFGLSGIFGSSVQAGDSYIVASYIESVQLVRDVKEQLGIDLRQYFARNDIDFYYRIRPDMPLEKFTEYWRDMIEVSFNSTTGNTTLYIYGFSSDDSKAIADAVLKVSETLVNNLSEANRQQMTLMASKQVDRSEDRLRKVRDQIRELRSKEKTIDFVSLSQSESQLTQNLENQLQTVKTRLATALQSVAKDSPSARMLQKQINSLEAQLAFQREKMGVPDGGAKNEKPGDDRNIAEVLTQFEELTVEQGFATQAYTTALAAFETALAEAQKQERYFATFVAPTRPEIALYPMRILDTFISLLVLMAVWMITQFLYRSFRDHAI